MRRGLVVAGLTVAVLAGSQSRALAGPMTFATFASVQGGLNLSSNLTELSVGAILNYTQLIPPILAPATPSQFIYLSVAPTILASVTSSGGTETFAYGPGEFDFTFVDPIASTFTPILHGTFANLHLVAPAGAGGFSFGGATATLSGLAFELSGLANTGTLLFTLGAPVFNSNTGGFEYSLPYGELTAHQVPEPASAWLLGAGLTALCAFRRRHQPRREKD